ncbi:MAG: hypothetical protein U0Y68_14645 [Blastocatellia bacterium]
MTWQVNNTTGGNATVGTISNSGLYTAPALVPAGTITVTAVSQADATKKANATITLTPALVVTVCRARRACRRDAAIHGDGHGQCESTAVTWQVNGITGGDSGSGTITPAGLFTAPGAIPPAGYVTVTAISQVDNVTKGSTNVSLTDPLAITYGRFLDQTTFGPNATDLAHVRQVGMQAYLNEQFNTAESPWPSLATATRRCD